MPANLPPQYYELEREFRAEKDLREKLRLAEELLRIMPKHKGTDKLQAEMKAKISRIKQDIEGPVKGPVGAKVHVTHDHIEREGAGQVILIGPPNTGKSSLLESLTHAKPLVADFPYTTREPLTGMMTFETVQIQLIDTPPISHEQYEPYMTNLIRNADVVVPVCDVTSPDLQSSLQFLLQKLDEKRLWLRPSKDVPNDDARISVKKALVCAHKEIDSGDDSAALATLQSLFPGCPIVRTSVLDDESLTRFRRAIFDSLAIVRVYTKQIGHDVALVAPVILPMGGTVEDAATSIHKDFAAKLKFARVWGTGVFEGQRVQRDYQLHDGDVVEFHI